MGFFHVRNLAIKLVAILALFGLGLVSPDYVLAQKGVKKVKVSPNDYYIASLENGKRIYCLSKNNQPGNLKTIRGVQYFIFLNSKNKKKIKRIRAKDLDPDVEKRKIKKLKKKYRKFRKACKAENPDNTAPVPTDDLSPYHDNITWAEAQHLYRRAGFGGTYQEVTDAVNAGLTTTLNKLFTVTATPAIDAAANAIIENEGNRWFGTIRQGFLYQLVNNPNQLREKMAYFWHDRFAASGRVADGENDFIVDYMNILREDGLNGNLRDFAKRMTINGLMLQWLDGATNTNESVNENYAREFWELYTLGIGNYTEKDVNESARCLTGWQLDWDDNTESLFVNFDLDLFDSEQKTVFESTAYEKTGNFDTFNLVDMTLDRGDTAARYMAKNLFEFFAYKDPPEAVIAELANLVIQNNYQFAPVVRRILASKAFFSAASRKNGVKTPLEFSVGFLRTLNIGYLQWTLESSTSSQGLQILNPPSVKGWDDNTYWLNDQWMLNRLNFVHTALDAVSWHDDDFDYRSFFPHNNATASEFLDHALAVMDVTITSSQRSELMTYLTTREGGGDVFGIDYSEIEDWEAYLKTSGLYYILAHFSEYNMR